MTNGHLSLQRNGYRLATAEILYHLPDHPSVLQSFVWQHLDLAPHWPELRKFLDYWARNIHGRLHSVRVTGAALVRPGQWRNVTDELRLH